MGENCLSRPAGKRKSLGGTELRGGESLWGAAGQGGTIEKRLPEGSITPCVERKKLDRFSQGKKIYLCEKLRGGTLEAKLIKKKEVGTGARSGRRTGCT